VCIALGAVHEDDEVVGVADDPPVRQAPHAAIAAAHGGGHGSATGQEDAVDEEQAAALLVLMQGMGVDAFRAPGVFGPALPASDDAPPHARLLAFLGRAVTRREAVA
jgi:hypothetical protein